MVPLLRLAVPFLAFPVATAFLFRFGPQKGRMAVFAAINLLGALGLALVSSLTDLFFWQLVPYLEVVVPVFVIYLGAILLHYLLVRRFAKQSGWLPVLAFLFPIALMIVVKYVPALSIPFRAKLDLIEKKHVAEFFIGISYMAFRLSHLATEVRNGVVEIPTLSEYLSFAFFVPTLFVGPISRYSVFRQSLERPDRTATPLGNSYLRIVKGITKYLFIGTLLEQLSYGGLLRDSKPHPWMDLPVAVIATYLYLYMNFSGYCDMAIGTAGLVGIQVEENFAHPFLARNLQEFWNNWHITLSTYMRDMVFSPLVKVLSRRFDPRAMPHVIAFSIFAVFALMGAWHGLAANFLIYGSLHGIGVVSCHYYTLFLKKRLGKVGYQAYQDNDWIRWAGIVMTFLYAAGTLFFFSNSIPQIRDMWQVLR
jgi:D-alanyl-lipoteichoic acid acyltransferase DltB (MBOAT superfamily)